MRQKEDRVRNRHGSFREVVGRAKISNVDAVKGARCGTDCNGIVCMYLRNFVGAFVEGFRFFGGPEIGPNVDAFVDDIVVTDAVVVCSE